MRKTPKASNNQNKPNVSEAATPTKTPNNHHHPDQSEMQENRRMAAFIYGPTPKKSIVKRLLESATPSKMKRPRKILMRQNDEIMNITLTRYKDPNICLSHFQEALIRKGFQCKRKDFSLKCFNQSIRLTLEVCIYNNQCAIQRKRIKGDAWQYKLVCEEILRISNTSNNNNNNNDTTDENGTTNKIMNDNIMGISKTTTGCNSNN